ncbi:MAG: LacI family DNA-binding transcriptional regulator [Sphaerochaetaceae bacterium]|nr:LacI family DNA-binding transcriptional regulator [Sphaerochaetaceae bacterium]
MRKKSITISDIAEKTGYSKTTVSFAFNWPNRISSEAVAKIMQCAKEMGYKGSGDTYSDTDERYKTICMLVPEFLADELGRAPLWARPTMCLYYLCEQHGFMLSMIKESHLSDTFFSKYSAVDAFMLFGKTLEEIEPSFLDIARRRHLPVISINTNIEGVSEQEVRSLLEKRTSDCAQFLFDVVSGKDVTSPEAEESYLHYQI